MSLRYDPVVWPGRRSKNGAHGPENACVNTGVQVSVSPGQIVVIVYGLVAKVELPKSTANAQVLFVVRDSMLLRDSAIFC